MRPYALRRWFTAMLYSQGRSFLSRLKRWRDRKAAQEYLLRRLFRLLAIAEEGKRKPHDETLVSINDEPKGVLVPS
jgi:hypothetical protein